MPPVPPPPRQWPRHRISKLHRAALEGSVERTVALLPSGLFDIDGRAEDCGYTPLMIAAGAGHSRVVRILLNKGANVSVVDDSGSTALHLSAGEGHLAVTKLMVKAGADPDAAISDDGATPLHQAAHGGHSEVMSVLIEAGANPNSQTLKEMTPLYMAANGGRVEAVKMLLQAKADPLLAVGARSGVESWVPLDVAAHQGHSEVVRELVQRVGIGGCGGDSGGVDALEMAAKEGQKEIMGRLTGAGVVDTGVALTVAAKQGREESVKFLLQQKGAVLSEGGYVNVRDQSGRTSLLCCVSTCRPCSARIMQMLVDAGADTTSTSQLMLPTGDGDITCTPLSLTTFFLREKVLFGGEDITEEELHRLEAIRRLLLRVDAIRAVSWLWPSAVPYIAGSPAELAGRNKKTSPTSLTAMLPILRRRIRRRRILLSALFRYVGK